MVMSVWGMHRDRRFYPEPESFNPGRWTEGFADHLSKFAYLPFGIGTRRCIGSGFAIIEATLALAATAQAFRLDLVPAHKVIPVAASTLRPAGGVKVVLRRGRSHTRPGDAGFKFGERSDPTTPNLLAASRGYSLICTF
jgi:cytochrome P450